MSNLRTMRTIESIMSIIKSQDPDTALTKTALRSFVVTGTIPSVKVGNKYLIALEDVEAFLGGASA